MSKKRLMFIGSTAAGKSTLSQYLNGHELQYKKTQAIEIENYIMDTPGEYLEHRRFRAALQIAAADADIVVFTQDPTAQQSRFSPGHAAMFPIPVIGLVTKIDIANEEKIEVAKAHLESAGADPIFCVSAFTGENMDVFVQWLEALP